MSETFDVMVKRVANETGYGELQVTCALTSCHESRALKAIGRSGVDAVRKAAKRVPVGKDEVSG